MKRIGPVFCWLFLALAGLSALSAQAAKPAKEDAFLDQPFPPSVSLKAVTFPPPGFSGQKTTSRMLEIPSFWTGVKLLGKMTGKKVALPVGLVEWPEERTERTWKGMSLGATNRRTVRELFESVCFTLSLDWKYDAKLDVIRLEPMWRRDESRSGRELINVLLATRPVEWAKLPQNVPNRLGGRSLSRDKWRLAFDGLLSKPENFLSGGALRIYHDTHGLAYMGDEIVINLYTGKMLDAEGRQRTIVVNGQSRITTMDNAGDIACYTFDEKGRLVGGGVYSVAEQIYSDVGGVQAAGKRELAVMVGDRGNPEGYLYFTLVEDKLALHRSVDADGKERDAQETRRSLLPFGKNVGRLKFGVSTTNASQAQTR